MFFSTPTEPTMVSREHTIIAASIVLATILGYAASLLELGVVSLVVFFVVAFVPPQIHLYYEGRGGISTLLDERQ